MSSPLGIKSGTANHWQYQKGKDNARERREEAKFLGKAVLEVKHDAHCSGKVKMVEIVGYQPDPLTAKSRTKTNPHHTPIKKKTSAKPGKRFTSDKMQKLYQAHLKRHFKTSNS